MIAGYFGQTISNTYTETRNVSMGHEYPRYCQIRKNIALTLTKAITPEGMVRYGPFLNLKTLWYLIM